MKNNLRYLQNWQPTVLVKLSVEEFLDGKDSTLRRMYNLQDKKRNRSGT